MRHPSLDLRQLRAFVTLAEEMHFGRAAVRLGIAQPPLSQQIQRLERRVGHRLLSRGGSAPMRLTPAGQILLITARQALDGLDRGLEAARGAARGERGLVRVGFTPSIALTILPPIVRAFRTRFPAVELELSELTSAEQVERVRTGRLDAGFVRDPPPLQDLAAETVAHEPLAALLPCAHRLAPNRRVALSDLAGEPFVLVRAAAGPSFRQRFLQSCREAGFDPLVAQEAGEWATVAGLVSCGLGVAVAPISVARIRLAGMVHRSLSQAAASCIVLVSQPMAAEAATRNFLAMSCPGRDHGTGAIPLHK